jgi:hypothetical protein
MHHRGVEIEAKDNSAAFTIQGNLIYIPFEILKCYVNMKKNFLLVRHVLQQSTHIICDTSGDTAYWLVHVPYPLLKTLCM